jgi:thiamine biosynthesis protein ThiI
MAPVIVLHHHEIVLKGANRGFFERQLAKNLRRALAGIIAPERIQGKFGRTVIALDGDEPSEEIARRLATVFGLAKICTGVRVEADLEEIGGAAEAILEGVPFSTIRVDARRVDKNFPLNSMGINAAVGARLCSRYGVRANLTSPDATIHIALADRCAYVYRSKVNGAGGLPVGVSGKVIGLLSAGFDSPVACWRLMKRGATVVFVHFHSMPYTGEASVDQVRQLVELLARYQFGARLHLIPFAALQQEIVLRAPQKLRVVLYRRFMLRIAEAIARREKAEALLTGEAVGQVASQTLRNIRVIEEAVTYPILRPLAGSDKEETLATARLIGTYDISSSPYDDCCSFLAPRKPETWADPAEVRDAEASLDIGLLVGQALEAAVVESHSSTEPEAIADAAPV